jgi:hypothetical protein
VRLLSLLLLLILPRLLSLLLPSRRASSGHHFISMNAMHRHQQQAARRMEGPPHMADDTWQRLLVPAALYASPAHPNQKSALAYAGKGKKLTSLPVHVCAVCAGSASFSLVRVLNVPTTAGWWNTQVLCGGIRHSFRSIEVLQHQVMRTVELPRLRPRGL